MNETEIQNEESELQNEQYYKGIHFAAMLHAFMVARISSDNSIFAFSMWGSLGTTALLFASLNSPISIVSLTGVSFLFCSLIGFMLACHSVIRTHKFSSKYIESSIQKTKEEEGYFNGLCKKQDLHSQFWFQIGSVFFLVGFSILLACKITIKI
jgi:hypothetical protein